MKGPSHGGPFLNLQIFILYGKTYAAIGRFCARWNGGQGVPAPPAWGGNGAYMLRRLLRRFPPENCGNGIICFAV